MLNTNNMNDFEVFRSPPETNNALATGSLDWLKNQARFGVPVWAVCLNCDHSRLLDAADLLAMVKPDLTDLSGLTDRLLCRACRGKACELRAATPIPEYCS